MVEEGEGEGDVCGLRIADYTSKYGVHRHEVGPDGHDYHGEGEG